ncbi:low molecular weight phosphotyrosine protein phosphatase [[Candida] jaroonii]|uniref:Low molecular weight phosphotyrosine protein phosphatase n=1 Tax=[Candida] jaroonii TaxID=467808 RepID=A0ACA9Y673_9ASCO|nr:low molecular weight phosphotyrosine protein phosphatase [[Candida] jaroonii]
MAEAIFKHKVKEAGLEDKVDTIDSFGIIGFHTGDSPDSRSIRTCHKHGVPINHQSQQISKDDFYKFDYLMAMDEGHLSDLHFSKPRDSKCIVKLFGEWKTDDKLNKVVVDPYYSNSKAFEYNFQQLSHFTDVFIQQELS